MNGYFDRDVLRQFVGYVRVVVNGCYWIRNVGSTLITTRIRPKKRDNFTICISKSITPIRKYSNVEQKTNKRIHIHVRINLFCSRCVRTPQIYSRSEQTNENYRYCFFVDRYVFRFGYCFVLCKQSIILDGLKKKKKQKQNTIECRNKVRFVVNNYSGHVK